MDRRAFAFGPAADGFAGPAFAARSMSDFRNSDLMTGGVALQTSQVALRKAATPDVRAFAQAKTAERIVVANMLGAAPGSTPIPAPLSTPPLRGVRNAVRANISVPALE